MNPDNGLHVGHRNRLRCSFLSETASLSDKELLELLLTYAIPRKDTAQLAEEQHRPETSPVRGKNH